MAQLKSDPARTLIFPSPEDIKTAHAAFHTVTAEWAATDPHNRELLAKTNTEIAKLRATE
jgi:TRAP-type transport system periplasmic protein